MDVAGETTPARFFDGIQATAQPVRVSVVDGVAIIRALDGTRLQGWPTQELVAQPTPDGAVAVRRKNGPARLITDDPALLQALRPALRRWPRAQTRWGAALGACVAVLLVGVVLIDRAPGLLAPLVPLAWENAWGAPLQRILMTQSPRCTGAAGQAAIDALAARLSVAGGITSPVQVAVLDGRLVNAFTFPGNRVVIMRGLITQAQDGNELAGVLGHELGHVKHRDAVRALLRQLGLNAVAAAVGWGDFSGGGVAATLLGLSYGRAAEASADDFAIATLHAAGLRADGLEAFFVHIQRIEGTVPGFLSDHPPTADRLQRARQPPIGEPAFDDGQWRAVRAMCEKAA